MATVKQEITSMLAIYLDDYDGVATNYYDASTLALVEPDNPDRILQLIVEIILGAKQASQRTYNQTMTDQQKIDLYGEVVADLTDAITDLTAVKTEIDAYYQTLL